MKNKKVILVFSIILIAVAVFTTNSLISTFDNISKANTIIEKMNQTDE